jgi:hypothetical protein
MHAARTKPSIQKGAWLLQQASHQLQPGAEPVAARVVVHLAV